MKMRRHYRNLGLLLAVTLSAGALWMAGGAHHSTQRGAPVAKGTSPVSSAAVASLPGEVDAVKARTYELKLVQELSDKDAAGAPLRLRATLAITPRDQAGRDLVRL